MSMPGCIDMEEMMSGMEQSCKIREEISAQNQMMDITIRKQVFVLIFSHLRMVHVLK